MSRIKNLLLLAAVAFIPMTSLGASPKRGICWEEGRVNLNEHHASLLSPGVSWMYNWGPSAANPSVYSEDFYYVPMAWNGAYNASRIRTWLSNHPETRYLLGFNEPNLADQAAMTPAQAVAAWPGVEALAQEFNVKLVAPALNFSGSKVGGKVWGVYEWYDEFFRLYPEAHVDCLALHCYMNWYSALTWFATEYFYKDLYNPSNENYGKYPYLVKFLDDFKKDNGHFPKMMLTEFCGWEYDYLPDVYFQIDQMTQKVQKLEQSDLVEGYAWFMGNAGSGASAFPYMSVFQVNSVTSDLSELGEVYVNMSAFDESRFYKPSEMLMAKDYVDATTDNEQVKVRPNSEFSSSIPLQIEIPANGWAEYLIDVPEQGTYNFKLHVKSEGGSQMALNVGNGRVGQVNVPDSKGQWLDVELEAQLPAGNTRIKLANTGVKSVAVNEISFSSPNGIEAVVSDNSENETVTDVYDMHGINLGITDLNKLAKGVYVIRKANGECCKVVR
ncbi:MAG: hypothetical protein K2L96_01220 [Muribaculaceae bacterium]|nr:hypothetical protein [Muribaculaceae bacterium]